MPTPPLEQKVRALDAEVRATEAHVETADHLDAVKRQLDTVLLDPRDANRYTSLVDRLRAATADFETHHPRLAALSREVTDALAAAGL